MIELMAIFESGDKTKLDDYLSTMPDDETRKQLLAAYVKLRQFKQEYPED